MRFRYGYLFVIFPEIQEILRRIELDDIIFIHISTPIELFEQEKVSGNEFISRSMLADIRLYKIYIEKYVQVFIENEILELKSVHKIF